MEPESSSSAPWSIRSPTIVAFTTLIGLRLPSALATTSFTPTASMTARTAPPALTPDPGCAGFMSTIDAPK